MMKKQDYLKITCVFDEGRLTVEIPRKLVWNYYQVWGGTENAMKVVNQRIMLSGSDDYKAKRAFYNLNKDRFRAHEEVFESVLLEHTMNDATKAETYIGECIDHWLEQMEKGNREPKEYQIIRTRGTRKNRVEVLKYYSRRNK